MQVSRSTRAVVTAALAALVAVAALLGEIPVMVTAGALALTFAYGWPALVDLPWPGGARAVLAIVGLGAVVAVLDDRGLAYLPFVAAGGLILSFVREMLRGDGRAHLVESLCGTVGGVFIVLCASGWVAVYATGSGESVVVCAAVTLAVASAVAAALPWRGWRNVGLTVGSAVGAGVALAALLPEATVVQGIALGATAGVLAASLHVLFERLPQASTRTGGLAAALVPVLVGGMLVHVVAAIVA